MAAAAVAAAALLAACGGSGDDGTSATSVATEAPAPAPVTSTGAAPTAPATTVEGPAHDVVLWFVKDGQLASVTRKAPDTAAATARPSICCCSARPRTKSRRA